MSKTPKWKTEFKRRMRAHLLALSKCNDKPHLTKWTYSNGHFECQRAWTPSGKSYQAPYRWVPKPKERNEDKLAQSMTSATGN